MKNIEKRFDRWASKVSKVVGSPYWLFFSIALVIIWLPSGFFIGFNEVWHLLINTTTTILTFIMMALLHASQSTWENKMEKMQIDQERILKLLEKETERIITNTEPKLESNPDNLNTPDLKERIDSLN